MKGKWKYLLMTAFMGVSMVACKKSNDIGYIHLSLDDTMYSFQNLANYKYDSIFEENFFKELKRLHDDYGAVVSLYTYNSALERVPDRYKADFQANTSWLKIGLHSNEHAYRMSEETYENGLSYWNTFVGHIERICGTTEIIDRIPRLEFYAGSEACVVGMKDAKVGALGFLTRGDGKKAYYYNEEVSEYIAKSDYVRDETRGFLFLPTDILLEETTDPYKELSKRKEDSAFKNKSSTIIIYSHEYYIYNGDTAKEEFSLLESCCRFAKDNNIKFGFPQEKTYAPSKGDSLF